MEELLNNLEKSELIEIITEMLGDLSYADLMKYIEEFDIFRELLVEIKNNLDEYEDSINLEEGVICLDKSSIANKGIDLLLVELNKLNKDQLIDEIYNLHENYEVNVEFYIPFKMDSFGDKNFKNKKFFI